MLPPGQIFAVEKLLPFVGITLTGILIVIGSERERYESSQPKNRNNKSFHHEESPEFFSVSYS